MSSHLFHLLTFLVVFNSCSLYNNATTASYSRDCHALEHPLSLIIAITSFSTYPHIYHLYSLLNWCVTLVISLLSLLHFCHVCHVHVHAFTHPFLYPLSQLMFVLFLFPILRLLWLHPLLTCSHCAFVNAAHAPLTALYSLPWILTFVMSLFAHTLTFPIYSLVIVLWVMPSTSSSSHSPKFDGKQPSNSCLTPTLCRCYLHFSITPSHHLTYRKLLFSLKNTSHLLAFPLYEPNFSYISFRKHHNIIRK